ncbi:MAG: ABC transporter ATP-binding protein/permease [Puniceicoccales bacterium]|jgi:ATP-binding cassette subfamily B protein|nr:ABC transporter ATP-binding protein/permease [Puniceicoccales bacterium]
MSTSAPQTPLSHSNIALLWQLMHGQRLRCIIAFICLLLAVGLGYLVPLAGSVALDHAIATAPTLEHAKIPVREISPLLATVLAALGGAENLRAKLWLAVVAMTGLSIFAGAFSYLKGWLSSLASDGIARDLKDRLYNHLNHLPARYHDRANSGDLVQRCTSDIEIIRQFFAMQIMEIGNALILLLTVLPLMLLLNPWMTLISFLTIPPLLVYSYTHFRNVRRIFKSIEETEGVLTGIVQENLTGIRVVRAFARQDFETRRFEVPNAEFRDKSLRMNFLMARYWSICDGVCTGQRGLTLLCGVWWVAHGTLSLGELFAFAAYLVIMLAPVRGMGRVLSDLGKTTIALARIGEVLAQPVEADDAPRSTGSQTGSDGQTPASPATTRSNAPTAAPPVHGDAGLETGGTRAGTHLVVRDLRFTHQGMMRPALEGINFEAAPGETIAIIGPSGAGKSTLMHLLLRLYDYNGPGDTGSIRINERELSTIPRKEVRATTGVVMQEPFLYAKTLRDNLRLGRYDAPQHELENAARDACIHESITGFDHGYDTLIGERGITLSGGQRQRMAIARALVKKPPLLLLDDALSAVDSETEALIIRALRRRHGNATTLVIAHRLSTLAHADRVLVLEHGRIVQTGTCAELESREGLYRRLWQLQSNIESELHETSFAA